MSLSEKEISFGSYKLFYKEDVKEFIKRDTDLINKYILGEINLITLRKRRRKLAGEKLI